MKKNYWNGLVLKLKRTLYPINRILHLFSYLSLATKKSKKMKFCYLMLATYSFNPSVPIFILTIFVVILRIIINSNMISIASSAILSTLVFYILPVNALLSLSLILCWNSQSINYRISIVPYLYWPRNLITYRRKFIEILTFFIKETQKFFIMTVRTITLKSNKKMNLKNTEKAKNIVQILS